MLKKTLSAFILLFGTAAAQTGYVSHNHPVHDFLQRMDVLQIIDDYDPFELPKSRGEIADHLVDISAKRESLGEIDENILNDFLIEFEYDISFTTENYTHLLNNFDTDHFFGRKEKFVYFYADTNNFSFFANFEGSLGQFYRRDFETKDDATTALFNFGGSIRGSVSDNIGFYFKATNGTFAGDRDLAASLGSLRYNFKFNEYGGTSNSGGDFYDETEGYFAANFDHFKFKIGRDRINIGYGRIKNIFGDNPPPMDYIGMEIKYSFFSFSYYHGKLFGSKTVRYDSLSGTIRTITDKYFGYHRFGFNFTRHFTFGFGETIIYADRPIDFSYLNPFNFYQSVEHANQDRDNAALFFDFTNNSIKGIKFFGTLYLDDLDFGKLGTSWYGNQAVYNLGMNASVPNTYFPLDIYAHYMRIDPYSYTHRLAENNYTSSGYPIASVYQPNSLIYNLGFTFLPHYRIKINLDFVYSRHGANELNEDGTLKVNWGGDINHGIRKGDPNYPAFLSGDPEYSRRFSLEVLFEPINNYFVNFYLIYRNNSLRKSVTEEFLDTSVALLIKI